jgi:hypothetical protein
VSDPGTAAWEEAVASVPASVIVYPTLELQHPGFVDESDNPIPIRAVTGVRADMDFGIEDGAVFDAGTMATFKAIPFGAEYPEVGEGKLPESRVTIDNVARELVPHIRKAMTYRADLIAIYREYRSDDLATPCYGPVEFVIRNAMMVGATITGMARLDNLANKKFPSKVYTLRDYPGLQP